MSHNPKHVLLIEDDAADVKLFQFYLKRDKLNPFTVSVAEDIVKATTLIKQNTFDLIVLDLNLGASVGKVNFNIISELTMGAVPILVYSVSKNRLEMDDIIIEGAQYLVKGDEDEANLSHTLLDTIAKFKRHA